MPEVSSRRVLTSGNCQGSSVSTPFGGQVDQAVLTSSIASAAPERWPWNSAISKNIQKKAAKNITSEQMNMIMP